MNDPLKLLVVFAHPDDESMGMGGTLAKYSAEGVETYCLCASRGERGWSSLEEQDPGPERVAEIRTQELQNAVHELGMKDLYFMGYMDGDVDQAEPSEAIGRIVAIIRRIKPQVVVTFPPDGNYGHPDHIAIGQFTTAAIVCAADASYADIERRAAHRVSKLYFMVDGENFVDAIAPYMDDMSFPVDEQIRGEVPWKEWMITTRIDVADYCRTAWRAIRHHKSQLASLGRLADLPEEAILPILAKQGTFYRAYSLVNGGREMETDLFEGLR